jgi:zinc transporter 1/2/3
VPLARNASVVLAYLRSMFAGDASDVFPYGVDPAFLRSSAALYRPELMGRQGWWYNTSDPTQVAPTTQAPFGFFHRPLKVWCSCTHVCACMRAGVLR